MAEVAIKIHIGNREYPLRVQEENLEAIQDIAKSVSTAIETRKRQLGIADMQDALAMTVFDCFVKEKVSENRQLATTDETLYSELQILNRNIEQALSL
jgi:cell division protein ZapA